ncbi:MAG: hypothetical protein JNK90_22415 [Planctomycetaceae bacterium]|nr:hypothetical protein [Planctomycetaceae bacterium]
MDARYKTDEGWMPEFRFFEGGSDRARRLKRRKPEGTGWGINEVPKTYGNQEGTGIAIGSGGMPVRGWETNGDEQQGGQKEKSGQVNEVPEELPIPKRENPYYQVWKNTDDLDNEIAARRMGMIMQPNRRRFFEEEIAQLEEARNVIVGPRQSVLFESYKDWNKNSLDYYVAALNGDIQTGVLDSVMFRTGQVGRTTAVVAGTHLVIVAQVARCHQFYTEA